MTVMTAPTATARDAVRHSLSASSALATTSTLAYFDPLDEDEPSDDVVVTTRRAISRVALVASEVSGRFQREGVLHDPMTWMLSPRALFFGATALDACLDREACMRGILLHGLSIGLDADPAAIDALASDEDEEIDFTGVQFERGYGHGGEGELPPSDRDQGEPRLFTATVVANDGFEIVQAFHASIASEEAEIAGRLYTRMGAAMADAVIVEGFDPSAALVTALVAPALCETLALVAADPSSPLAAGLDLNVEQRFLS